MLKTLLSILFPTVCVSCNKMGSILCKSCTAQILPSIIDSCPYCYKPSPWGDTHERCRVTWGLDGAISCLRYNQTARDIVKRMKYSLVTQAFSYLTRVLPKHWWRIEEYSQHIQNAYFLQPIPLHSKRFRARGFNQAEIITKYLGRKFEKEVGDCMIRRKETAPQAQQHSRAARHANIQNAFSMKSNITIKDKTILLIDDVFTSGSTAKEAAKTLKQAGAARVYLYTLAHGN